MTNATAEWAAKPIFVGRPDFRLHPVALGPRDVPKLTDPKDPFITPQLALFSVLAHARGQSPAIPALVNVLDDALDKIDTERAADYTELALELLSGRALTHLEGIMATMTKRYQSAFARRLRDEGMSHGEARMLLFLLESRGIELTEPQRTLINTCTDTDQLKTWFERGLKANAAADVFA